MRLGFLIRWLDRVYLFDNEQNRYQAMEGLRGYAVLAVFLVHTCGLYLSDLVHVKPDVLSVGVVQGVENYLLLYFYRSHYGVDIFFLLSGFLIFRMVAKGNFRFHRFLGNRFLRIYPAFLVALAVYVVVNVFIMKWVVLEPKVFAQNLLFLNGIPGSGNKAYVHVTWSLFYEFSFYLIFPAAFFLLRLGDWLRILLFTAFVMALCTQVNDNYVRYVMFLVGAMIAAAGDQELVKIARRAPDGVVLAVYLATTLAYVEVREFARFIPFYAISSAFLVINAVYGNGFLSRLFRWRPLRYLGNISYSFYLIHPIAIWYAMYLGAVKWGWVAGGAGAAKFFSLGFLFSLLAGTLLFWAAERPYFTLRAKHFGRR